MGKPEKENREVKLSTTGVVVGMCSVGGIDVEYQYEYVVCSKYMLNTTGLRVYRVGNLSLLLMLFVPTNTFAGSENVEILEEKDKNTKQEKKKTKKQKRKSSKSSKGNPKKSRRRFRRRRRRS